MATYHLIIPLAAILVASTQSVQAQVYTGIVVHIRDGDTFVIVDDNGGGEEVPVRLCGVDSPERGQKGYRAAKKALTLLIHGKTVRCVQVGGKTPCDGRSPRKSRDRIVAQCFVGELDIAAEMVRSGNACDWQRFSDGYYRLDPTTCINPN